MVNGKLWPQHAFGNLYQDPRVSPGPLILGNTSQLTAFSVALYVTVPKKQED